MMVEAIITPEVSCCSTTSQAPGAEHRHLHRLARELGRARKQAAEPARLALLAQARRRSARSSAASPPRACRARRPSAVRVAASTKRPLRRASACTRSSGRRVKRSFAAASTSISTRAGDRERAEQRMEQPDQDEEQRQPGRVEQRDHGIAHQEAAQRRHVAQAVQVLGAASARGLRRAGCAARPAPSGGRARCRTRRAAARAPRRAAPSWRARAARRRRAWPASPRCGWRARGRTPAACTARGRAAAG